MTILELLEAHEYVPSHLERAYPVCLCLEWRASSPLAKRDEHRAHLAEVLEAHTREREAAAWDQGCASGLDAGLTIGEKILGIVPGRIQAPPQNPYRTEQPKEAHDGR